MPSKLVRWIPAAIAPVLVAGAVAVPVAASAAPDLAPKTPAQVLALVAKAKDLPGFSGLVQQRSDLGLPEIPSTGAGADSDTGSALATLTGDHDARVWVAGAERSRVAVLDDTEERDVVRTGSTVWLWDSAKQQATKVTLPFDGSAGVPRGSAVTPQEAADELLRMAGPTTATTVDTAQRVAGRDAYTLVLTPKTDETTVGSVRLAVDAASGLPLRVQVLARGASSPAFEVGFSTIDLSAPDAAEFRFTPPSGATVRQRTVDPGDLRTGPKPATGGARPTVTGEGWSSVVEAKADTAALGANPTVQRLTTPVAGGRVLRSSLVNVLLTDDGRVLAGAVPVARLTAVATG